MAAGPRPGRTRSPRVRATGRLGARNRGRVPGGQPPPSGRPGATERFNRRRVTVPRAPRLSCGVALGLSTPPYTRGLLAQPPAAQPTTFRRWGRAYLSQWGRLPQRAAPRSALPFGPGRGHCARNSSNGGDPSHCTALFPPFSARLPDLGAGFWAVNCRQSFARRRGAWEQLVFCR